MSKAAKDIKHNIPEDILKVYDQLIAAHPEIERKGATMPYTSMNGNMFSFINKEGVLGLRLAAAERDAFTGKYKTALCVEHGAVMKEYVAVPPALFKKVKELREWFGTSVAYAKTLKAKATKPKK